MWVSGGNARYLLADLGWVFFMYADLKWIVSEFETLFDVKCR